MARKKLDLTGALEDIIQRQKEAQELFEASGRKEVLFSTEEERAYAESLLEEPEYDWTVTYPSSDFEEPMVTETPEVEKPKLPEPEVLEFIAQSTQGSRDTHRPDLYSEYYKGGKSKQSTAVQAMQWIPTEIEEVEMPELADPFSVVGDLLVAFARPSKSQTTTGTLYVFSGVSREMWNAIVTSESFGKSVKAIGVGRLCSETDKTRYIGIHPEEEYWLFNLPWTSPRDVVIPPPPRVKKPTVKSKKRGKKDAFK